MTTTASVTDPELPWTANDATFGARLALIRQRMGWGNLKEGAVACGIPVESWRAWERDGGMPRRYLEICAQIAAATKCDYGWLVDRRPSGSSQPSSSRVGTVFDLLQGGGRNNKGMDRALLLPVPSN